MFSVSLAFIPTIGAKRAVLLSFSRNTIVERTSSEAFPKEGG